MQEFQQLLGFLGVFLVGLSPQRARMNSMLYTNPLRWAKLHFQTKTVLGKYRKRCMWGSEQIIFLFLTRRF